MVKRNNKPELLYLHMDITVKCNLYCSYCFYGDYNNIEKIKEEVSIQRLKEIVNEAILMGCKKIILSGGEVFTSEKFFPMLNFLAEKNMKIIFITNGTLVNKNNIKNILNVYDNIDEIKISFDGKGNDLIRGEGTSIKILDTINLFENEKLPWTVNTMISRYNYNSLLDIYEILKKMNPKYWRIDLPFSLGRYIENKHEIGIENLEDVFINLRNLLKIYLEEKPNFKLWMFSIYQPDLEDSDIIAQELDMHPCAYNKRNIGVRGNGEVTPCSRFFNFQFGNIKKNSLREIKLKDEYVAFWNIKISDLKDCLNCKYLYVCGGGCRANAVSENGGIYDKDPTACAIMPLFEKYIIPLFSEETQNCYNKLIERSLIYSNN